MILIRVLASPSMGPKLLNTQAAYALLDRWQRLELQVRCGLAPEHPGIVRVYVHAGLHLVRCGLRPARDVHERLLTTLLASARDEGLSWFWRSVCLENVNLPLALLRGLGAGYDAWEAAIQDMRDRLPATPAVVGA